MRITVSTVVDAPLAEVWRAYTTPEDIKAWNAASDDWHTTAATVDLRPGGKFSSRMEAKDGSFGFDFAGEYTTIVPHQVIEYTFGDRMASVTFTEVADGVQVTVSFDAEQEHSEEQQREGWQAILDNFARHVRDLSDRVLVVTRSVSAPRPLVFRAWSEAELFQRWWVPKSAPVTLLSCDMDVRTGGTYRLVFRHPAAPEPVAFVGRYLEVVPPSRIVWTNEEAGDAGQITTVTFEDVGGGTQIVMRDLYPSKAARDAAIAAGDTGWHGETFDQLDALLDALLAAP